VAGQKLIFCVCRDITQRKTMEQTLRESEEKFSTAFLASPQIIAITMVKDGKYIDINENYTHAIGYTREELIGHTAQSLNIWAKNSQRNDMLKTLAEKGRITEKEYKFRTKDGKIRTWLFSGEPITISGENCLMGVAIDITERKMIEAWASEAESLREIDKLRRELLANVSHELRTPLAGIKGFTTMLIDYGKRLKASEKQEYLETINNNADQLAVLIEQLLEMSRLGAGMLSIKKKPTDIIALCWDAVNEAGAHNEDHRFILDLPEKLPLIDIDKQRIHQVLSNLLGNAVKYSDSGTEIKLSVRETEGNLLFTITDHGCGISDEDTPHVFDRMFSSRNKHKTGIPGAGLGLPICKGLIEAHDGKIWFESKENVETSFYFTLPLKAKKEASPKPPAAN
jgi:PAS domain S-box-containing protein